MNTCEELLKEFLTHIEKGEFLSKGFRATVVEHADGVAGAALHLKITGQKQNQQIDYWLGPLAQGHPVMRFERRMNGKLYHEVSDCTTASSDGITYTKSSLYKNFYHKGDIHQLAESRRMVFDFITFRADQIPPALFDTTIPEGTTIIDRDKNNAVITDPVEARRAIDEAIHYIEPPPASWWKKWGSWVIGSLVLVLTLSITWGLRARIFRRTARSTAP